MILYTEYESEQVIFVVPHIEEPEESGSIMDKYKMRVQDGMYKYFPRTFILRCNEITVYDYTTDSWKGLKNRYSAVDTHWHFGTIDSRMNNVFKLATFHNGVDFSPYGDRTDFKVLKINLINTPNFFEYLRSIDEVYRFF